MSENKAISVLVADDDNDFRELTAKFLETKGYSVLQAEDGSAAVSIATDKAPDVILLDVMMPSKSGIDVCKELKDSKTTRSSVIIMLTVKNQLSDKLTAYMAGAQRYLIKGCEFTEVERCIQTALQQKGINQIQMEQEKE